MMLSTDTRILNVLLQAKQNGNELLQHFEIRYPDKTLNMDLNTIHVACVSSENHQSGLDKFQTFTDLVEVIITTKTLKYSEAIKVIKTVAIEIIRLCKTDPYLGNRLTVRSISPIHDTDNYQLKKGHLLFQFITEPVSWENDNNTITSICNILTENITEED